MTKSEPGANPVAQQLAEKQKNIGMASNKTLFNNYNVL